jgi:arylsulfatase A-like enzyme
MRLHILTILAAAIVAQAAPKQPNIIFILADDWGIGDIKTYGGERCKIDTPHMDQLARDGMKFMDAHSSSSVCTPTRYSVLTGRYNWRSIKKQGVLNGFSQALIIPGRETVASFLKGHGYHTAMIGKSHLGMDLPTTDGKPAHAPKKIKDASECNVDWKGVIQNGPNSIGFDYYWGIAASLDMPPYIWIENNRFVGECTTIKAFHRPGPAHADFEDYDVLPTLAKKASAYIAEQTHTKNPFFLYMPLNSPHTPISPSKAFQGKSQLGSYGDFVMETDWAVGEVVKAVEQAGIADNTLIIVTADNGCSPAALRAGTSKNIMFNMEKEEPVDAAMHYPSIGFRGHKADIYEGGHRVPFIARWSGTVKPGSTCNEPVCLVDLFATCADIVGGVISDTAAEDSVSLLPILNGTAKKPVREAVVHHSINGSFSIRQGHWKLNFCPGSGGWSTPKPIGKKPKQDAASFGADGWIKLYNLAEDPTELNNLAEQHPEAVERLSALAQKYIDDGRSTPGAPQSNDGETHLYPDWIRKARK